MKLKPLYLDMNLGLGDAIICNGLVRFLSADSPARKIIVPSWTRNLPTVRHMFSDLANVFVAVAEGDRAPINRDDYEIRSIGINNPKFGTIEPWDRAFYEFAGVPFGVKWDLFHVPPSGTEIPSHGSTSFGHDDPIRGFCIDATRFRISTWLDERALLTDWRNVIRDAREIHVIDSAPMHLAELLPTSGKLFYHKYARSAGNRNHRDATFRKDWTVYE